MVWWWPRWGERECWVVRGTLPTLRRYTAATTRPAEKPSRQYSPQTNDGIGFTGNSAHPPLEEALLQRRD